MKIGTKTVLFGVHQFLWHPFTVWRAWRWLYRSNPKWWQLVAIVCHDLGYIGKGDLDGREGRRHPDGGATITLKFVRWLTNDQELHANAFFCSLLHSRAYAQDIDMEPSDLCWADKACILFDPPWFYLLRARLAGELPEFKLNAEPYIGKADDEAWLLWYRSRIRSLLFRMDISDEAREDMETGKR